MTTPTPDTLAEMASEYLAVRAESEKALAGTDTAALTAAVARVTHLEFAYTEKFARAVLDMGATITKLTSDLATAKAEVARLKEALRGIAETPAHCGPAAAWFAAVDIARAALAPPAQPAAELEAQARKMFAKPDPAQPAAEPNFCPNCGAGPAGADCLCDLRQPAAEPASDMCVCGQPKAEHHHDGACYGLCGKFRPAPTPEPASKEVP